ncbi:MAG TPA: hypothetical protein VKT00_04970, partial [Casimicrobiaceae bacterium]|nr:hypothetical protein [Casimicrobiaceae bacterium]
MALASDIERIEQWRIRRELEVAGDNSMGYERIRPSAGPDGSCGFPLQTLNPSGGIAASNLHVFRG